MCRRTILVAILILGSLFLFAPDTKAAVGINSLSVKTELQLDGTVSVSQEIDLAGSSTLDWQVYSNWRHLTVTADGISVPIRQLRLIRRDNATRIISARVSGSRWRISYQTTGNLIRHNDRDQFFFKIFQEPGVSIGETNVIFTLPSSVSPSEIQSFTGNAYAIGGVSEANSEVLSDSRSIRYRAEYAGSKGLMTISASWPKSILQLNSSQEIRLILLNLESLPWIILGVSSPLAVLIILLVLIYRSRRQDAVKLDTDINQPPADLSPMIVGVLVNKKIYPEEIVALLIDLCYRGYLVIIKNGPDYFFGKRRTPDQHLQNWEKSILEQVLPTLETKISNTEVAKTHEQILFSPTIREAFNEIYEVITANHYFVENPHLTRIRYKLIALAFYFISVAGLVWTAIGDITPYLLIPLVGIIALSWLIFRLTAKLTRYTAIGLRQKSAWLSFGEFLSSPTPIDPAMARNRTFEKYLPYAIAMNKTAQWTNRFQQSTSTIVAPDWLVAYEDLDAGALGGELVDIVSKTSKLLANLRGPLVT